MEVLQLLNDNIKNKKRLNDKIKTLKQELRLVTLEKDLVHKASIKYIERQNETCIVCTNNMTCNNITLLPCSHILCKICVDKIITTDTLSDECPYCKQSINPLDHDPESSDDEDFLS